MFTPRSQHVARENSGINQSIVAVAGSAAQPIANANPYARPTGNKHVTGAKNQDIDLVLALSEPQ